MKTDVFAKCGANRGSMSYTDEELQEQIDVLSAVIAYFKARDDASIIVHSLVLEREQFQKFQEVRNRNH